MRSFFEHPMSTIQSRLDHVYHRNRANGKDDIYFIFSYDDEKIQFLFGRGSFAGWKDRREGKGRKGSENMVRTKTKKSKDVRTGID